MSEAILAAVNQALSGANSFESRNAATVGNSADAPSSTLPTKFAAGFGQVEDAILDEGKREMLPTPFYRYRDFSMVQDPDPFTPLTAPGRVPNFPAKVMAILSRQDLSDVVSWMPHGRAWRILKPREFEIKVIPTYFEHTKYSSFIRQSNGWGFRRITQGPDRNAYYHEQFLRGLPHLCKEMKRPGVNQKKTGNPEEEPDFYKIAELYPLPEKATDDSIMLNCTVQGGPKARMPIYTGAANYSSLDTKPAALLLSSSQPMTAANASGVAVVASAPPTTLPSAASMGANPKMPNFAMPAFPPGLDPAAAAQFAAGFAMAAAYSQQHFMASLIAQGQQGQQKTTMPQQQYPTKTG